MRCDWQVSIRRACSALRLDPKSYRYKSRRPDQALLKSRIREVCETRVRYGYRRVNLMLRRESFKVNHNKTLRVFKNFGLQLRNKNAETKGTAKAERDRRGYQP